MQMMNINEQSKNIIYQGMRRDSSAGANITNGTRTTAGTTNTSACSSPKGAALAV